MCYKTQLYLSFVIFGQIGASGQYFTNLKLEFMYIVRSALKSETSFNLCSKVGFWGQNRLEAATVHSMARANLNKNVWLVTNTTTASKYIPRRTRISIN